MDEFSASSATHVIAEPDQKVTIFDQLVYQYVANMTACSSLKMNNRIHAFVA